MNITPTTTEKNGKISKCDRCDQPAVSFARDMVYQRVASMYLGYEQFTPDVRVKKGCALHPVESREIR